MIGSVESFSPNAVESLFLETTNRLSPACPRPRCDERFDILKGDADGDSPTQRCSTSSTAMRIGRF
jgi:hypothetical protein